MGEIKMINTVTRVRPFRTKDFNAVKTIYQQGIETGQATFEITAPDWEGWDNKFLKEPRLVAVVEDKIAGWAALSAVSSRCVYAGVCEVSVYIHEHHRGQGAGTQLLKELINWSEQNNIWTLQAGIFPENKASLKIHASLGFREVGYREKIGKMNGIWRDTVLLERRSKAIV